MNFSQREGIAAVRTVLQTESISDELRANLWNVLHVRIWDRSGFKYDGRGNLGNIRSFSRGLWFAYFKKPFSTIPPQPHKILDHLEQYFFSCRWNQVYDFLEAVLALHEDRDGGLVKLLNEVLERELAGYRIVDKEFVKVTDPQEVEAIEQALQGDRFAPVANHLRSALNKLSDRINPDYRNSIKESISAVEAMAKILSGNDRATLDDALRTLEKKRQLHGALRKGFAALYGYTSDANGIRHAMMEEPELSAADAKFFLLSCTSFINYLKAQFATTGRDPLAVR